LCAKEDDESLGDKKPSSDDLGSRRKPCVLWNGGQRRREEHADALKASTGAAAQTGSHFKLEGSSARRKSEPSLRAGVDSDDIDKTNLLDKSGQTRERLARADGLQQRGAGWRNSTLGGGRGGSRHAER
jgi:hypothetical protein